MSFATHHLNRDFEWAPAAQSPRYLSTEQVRQYDEAGYFILESAFEQSLMNELIGEIDEYEKRVEEMLCASENGRVFIARAGEITFTTHLVTISERLREFCRSRVFADVAHDLIGPDVRLYWDQAVYKKPGTDAPFPWHQDNGYTFIEPQQYLTCWVALTDATRENGCPRVVPGMHRHGTLAHRKTDLGYVCFDEEPSESIPAPVRAGGMVVFSSLTPHSTGPNLSDSTRKAYIVQFAGDGAVSVSRDPNGRTSRVPADDAERQFPILVGGGRPA